MSEIFEGLNDGQLGLASTIEGPVYAGASAGSGKTHTLTRRIEYMLSSDAQIDPHSILCLTFTDSGAVALRQKLRDKIGQTAYEVTISTFHAFCSDVIQNNASYFGMNDMEPISRLEEIGIVEDMINKLSPSHALYRSKGNKYFEVPRLLALFALMKKDNYSMEYMQTKIKEFIDYLPQNEDFQYKRANKNKDIKKGDPNKRKINEVTDKMKTLSAAVSLFDIYNDEMAKMNRYDFNDMISWVIKAFKDNDDILLDYQERYLYLISDEAQDSSGSQHEIMNLLMGYWETPNIALIGDINQILYEFAGSNIHNIKNYIDKYNPAIVSLNKNYRSTQQIVDASIKVISKSKQDSDSDLNVQGMNESPSEITIKRYQSFTHENQEIADKIISLINEGVTPSDIYVIYRNHSHSKRLYEHLANKGIPVNTKRRLDVLNEQVVLQMITIMEYISSYTKLLKSDKFFEILHFSFFKVPRKHIEKPLVMRQKEQDLSVLDKRSFKEANRVIKTLEDLEYSARNNSVINFLSELIYNTGIKDALLKEKNSRTALVLRTFFDFAKTENEKNPTMTIAEFLEFIRRLRDNHIQINMDDVSGDANGVFFTTAHGSKGLEAKHVFLMRINRSDWEKSRSRAGTYSLPENITFTTGEDKEESTRRLFYVAMTRAEQYLHVSCSLKDDKGKDLEPSMFIDDMEYPIEEVEAGDLTDQLHSDLEKEILFFNPEIEKERIKEVLENFRMSPSSLNSYLRCALSFYYERILKVPFVDNYPIVYGNMFHRVIEESKKRMRNSSFNLDEIMNWGAELVDGKLGVSMTESERFRLKSALKEVFPKFYNTYLSATNPKSIPEYKIRDVVIDDVPCYGEVDDLNILQDGHSVVISDYKAGSEVNTKKKTKTGEDIWRQLVFYKLLIENVPVKNFTVTRSQVVGVSKEPFIIPGDIDFSDVTLVKDQIKEAYQNIMNMKFDGCGKEDCKWCNIISNG